LTKGWSGTPAGYACSTTGANVTSTAPNPTWRQSVNELDPTWPVGQSLGTPLQIRSSTPPDRPQWTLQQDRHL